MCPALQFRLLNPSTESAFGYMRSGDSLTTYNAPLPASWDRAQDAPDPPGLAGPARISVRVRAAPAVGDLIGASSPARRGCRHCVPVVAEHIGAAAHLCGRIACAGVPDP